MATKKVPPVEALVLDRGDMVQVTAKVVDSHDRGNIVLDIGGRPAQASFDELVAAKVRGGRVVLQHPTSGEVLQDPLGKLGPLTLDESKLPDDPDEKDEVTSQAP